MTSIGSALLILFLCLTEAALPRHLPTCDCLNTELSVPGRVSKDDRIVRQSRSQLLVRSLAFPIPVPFLTSFK